MASHLSDGLVALALSSGENRDAVLLRAVTDLYVQEAGHDPDEQRRYEEIANHFLPKVAARDRAYVADRLAECPSAPLSVLRLLAKDLIEVATPILRHSTILSSFDLLAIMAATGPLHYRLIAKRPNLSVDVMTALRLTGDRETIETLIARRSPAHPAPAEDDAPADDRSGAAEATRDIVRALTAELAAELEALSLPVPRITRSETAPLEAPETAARAAQEPAAEAAPIVREPVTPSARPAASETAAPPESRRPIFVDAGTFLRLDSAQRTELLLRRPGVPLRPPVDRGVRSRAEAAFRAMSAGAALPALARRRQREALIDTMAKGLGLSTDIVEAMVDDPFGEPLVLLLKAINLPDGEAQQVLLLANRAIGAAVTTFFRLVDLQAALDPAFAKALVQSWRTGEPARAGHQPVYDDAERPARQTGIAAGRATAPLARPTFGRRIGGPKGT